MSSLLINFLSLGVDWVECGEMAAYPMMDLFPPLLITPGRLKIRTRSTSNPTLAAVIIPSNITSNRLFLGAMMLIRVGIHHFI